MPVTYSDAIDELYGIVNSMLASTAAVIGENLTVFWPGAAKATKPPQEKFWARVSSQIVTDEQCSLANADGKHKYHATGLLFVQVFCPRTVAGALPNGRSVAELIRDEFRKPSPSGALTFSDQKIKELDVEPECYPLNVVVTFEYDTVK